MKTHWKKLTNPDYFGAYCLDEGEERTVEIVKVVREMVTGADGKKEECTVAHLKGEKPLILNATNCKTITKVLKTPFIEQWANKRVILITEKVKAFGDVVDAIRIKQQAAALPELKPDTEQWTMAIKAIADGYTIDKIKQRFTLSQENEAKLLSL